MRKRIACLLLAAAALCAACLSALAQEDNPVVVRVNDKAYYRKDIQSYYNIVAQSYVDAGREVTTESADAILDMVIDGYADLGVIELKCVELGLDTLTDADETQLRQAAQDGYDQLSAQCVEQLMSQYDQTREEAEEAAPLMMRINGFTLDGLYDQALAALRNARILEYVTGSVEVTDEQIQQFYNVNYAEADRALYENDIAAYEKYVFSDGKISYYTPAGYRRVDCVLFPASDDVCSALTALNDDFSESAESYRLMVKEDLLNAYGEQIAAIRARMVAGESVETIATDYADTDISFVPGFQVHAQSDVWFENFHEGAMALGAVGDVSEPLLLGDGINLLVYVSDIPEGFADLSAEGNEEVRAYILEQYKVKLLNDQVEAWKSEYTIELHPELLTKLEVLP